MNTCIQFHTIHTVLCIPSYIIFSYAQRTLSRKNDNARKNTGYFIFSDIQDVACSGLYSTLPTQPNEKNMKLPLLKFILIFWANFGLLFLAVIFSFMSSAILLFTLPSKFLFNSKSNLILNPKPDSISFH